MPILGSATRKVFAMAGRPAAECEVDPVRAGSVSIGVCACSASTDATAVASQQRSTAAWVAGV